MLGPPAAGVSRYPRVVPGWRRRIACTRNVPTANSPGSTCCTVSFADNASSGTGNTAGRLWGSRQGPTTLAAILRQQMDPAVVPVPPGALSAKPTVQQEEPGAFPGGSVRGQARRLG